MIQLYVSEGNCEVVSTETLVAGSKNVYRCGITFAPDWEDLDKTVCFRARAVEKSALEEDGSYIIPWEVLEKPAPRLQVGVTGTKDGDVVRPTVWADLGEIFPGAVAGEVGEKPPTNLYAKVLAVAMGVRRDADAGVFKGPQGEPGAEGDQGIGVVGASIRPLV